MIRHTELLYNCVFKCSVSGHDPSQWQTDSSAFRQTRRQSAPLGGTRDNDTPWQHVRGSASQTQTHFELAGLWRYGALYLATSSWRPFKSCHAFGIVPAEYHLRARGLQCPGSERNHFMFSVQRACVLQMNCWKTAVQCFCCRMGG